MKWKPDSPRMLKEKNRKKYVDYYLRTQQTNQLLTISNLKGERLAIILSIWKKLCFWNQTASVGKGELCFTKE